jgi:hypothetical protein
MHSKSTRALGADLVSELFCPQLTSALYTLKFRKLQAGSAAPLIAAARKHLVFTARRTVVGLPRSEPVKPPCPPRTNRAEVHIYATCTEEHVRYHQAAPTPRTPPAREPQTSTKELDTGPVTAVGFASINVEIRTELEKRALCAL